MSEKSITSPTSSHDAWHMTHDSSPPRDPQHMTHDTPHHALTPSIDFTMKSAAFHYQKNTIGVILTGMGQDGLAGMRFIRAAGGFTIAEDESSIIFGMPQKVIEAGLADIILPAEEIGRKLVEMS
jgi:two-component system chemotaxis response regulator CheB